MTRSINQYLFENIRKTVVFQVLTIEHLYNFLVYVIHVSRVKNFHRNWKFEEKSDISCSTEFLHPEISTGLFSVRNFLYTVSLILLFYRKSDFQKTSNLGFFHFMLFIENV